MYGFLRLLLARVSIGTEIGGSVRRSHDTIVSISVDASIEVLGMGCSLPIMGSTGGRSRGEGCKNVNR